MISGRNLITLSLTSLFAFSASAESSLESLEIDSPVKEENIVDYSSLDFSVIDIDTEENQKLLVEDAKISELRNIIENLDEKFKNAEISELDEIDGFYQVSNKTTTVYISEDGKYIVPVITKIVGNAFEDIQESKIAKKTKERIEGLPLTNLVKYPATSNVPFLTKIYVFSDFTCPICKRLHNDILELNNRGVEVNYIPYPRNGTRDKAALLGLQKIMCSTDPSLEFDKAFLNPRDFVGSIDAVNSSCIEGKRALHEGLLMGDEFDVRGTPYIFTEDGYKIVGYHGLNQFLSKLNLTLTKGELAK